MRQYRVTLTFKSDFGSRIVWTEAVIAEDAEKAIDLVLVFIRKIVALRHAYTVVDHVAELIEPAEGDTISGR